MAAAYQLGLGWKPMQRYLPRYGIHMTLLAHATLKIIFKYQVI